MKKNLLALISLALLFFQCSSKKNNLSSSLFSLFFIMNSKKQENERKAIKIDLSNIDESLQDVLYYRIEKNNDNNSLNQKTIEKISTSQEKNIDWKKLSNSKILEIQPEYKFFLSLGKIIPIGEKKFNQYEKLSLASIMKGQKQVENLKYMVQSLSYDKKNGKFQIEDEILKEFKNKKIDFSKSIEDFKKQALLVKVTAVIKVKKIIKSLKKEDNKEQKEDELITLIKNMSEEELGILIKQWDNIDDSIYMADMPVHPTELSINFNKVKEFIQNFYIIRIAKDYKEKKYLYTGRLFLQEGTSQKSKIKSGLYFSVSYEDIKLKGLQISTGDFHNLIYDQDRRKLLAFGDNSIKQLGLKSTLGNLESSKYFFDTPQEISLDFLDDGDKIKQIYTKHGYNLILTENNKFFEFGGNSLVYEKDTDKAHYITSPTEVSTTNIEGKIKKIILRIADKEAGNATILTNENKLFELKKEVSSFKNTKFIEQANNEFIGNIKNIFGYSNLFILTKKDKIHAFGGNSFGELGVGFIIDSQDYRGRANVKIKRVDPALIKKGDFGPFEIQSSIFDSRVVETISSNNKASRTAGFVINNNVYHPTLKNLDDFIDIEHRVDPFKQTFFLTASKNLYVAGVQNESFTLCLGREATKDFYLRPTKINGVENVEQVAAGGGHTLISTTENEVFACGDGREGQLGQDIDLDRRKTYKRAAPIKINLPTSIGNDYKIKKIFTGIAHSLILLKTEEGDKLLGFGSNNRGQLGFKVFKFYHNDPNHKYTNNDFKIENARNRVKIPKEIDLNLPDKEAVYGK